MGRVSSRACEARGQGSGWEGPLASAGLASCGPARPPRASATWWWWVAACDTSVGSVAGIRCNTPPSFKQGSCSLETARSSVNPFDVLRSSISPHGLK